MTALRQRQTIAVLALVGFFVALYLWLHALGVGGPLKCGTGACETVQTSPWAVFLGFPVAFYGVVGYGALFVVAIVAMRPAALGRRGWSSMLFAMASLGLLFTLYLTYAELFLIHAICRWCVTSATIITVIWVLTFLALRTDRAASPPPQDPQA